MRIYSSVVLALVVLPLAALPARAQDAKSVEVIPYVAVGTAAASPVGVATTVPLTSKVSLETDVAYRRGEGAINALSSSVSLLYDLPAIGHSTPYVAGGIGLAQVGAPIVSPSGPPIGTESRLALTINAGAGVKTAMTDKVGMRTDARWSKSFGRQGSEQFRVAQGISFDIRRK